MDKAKKDPITLDVASLFNEMKEFDDSYVKARKAHSAPVLSDTVLVALGIALAVLLTVIAMAAITKQFAYEGDQAFWNPMGLGFMIFLVVLALLWAAWFTLDAVHSALTMYRTRLTSIDQALRRDDWVAAALQERMYSARKQTTDGKASTSMEPAEACARLQLLIRHLQSECRVRLARANTGGLLGAMASLIITGSDTAQKLMQIKVPIEVPSYTVALAIGFMLGAILQTYFAARLSRLAELLERVVLGLQSQSSASASQNR
ncbi:hypothetical protein B9Y76_06630 [Stenotrophomonas maltophilia]|jgi:hypothetical protein|uniref:hypothetical protein n=1 Tax=Stenotrophomonas maltophilia TaxID=40324 RepID=UPI000B4E604D|nr:hypothetical protein [Stenotrophomonas maltophilia]MPS47260.1 hypothetical protein [Stenotrophomonas sp.]MBA0383716.1 hypothetical protein [Stenotrophomonas maltophilia]MBN5020283.1 hypothetical protein [Stenotrophomonas maltophilia]OWQ81696.1 hypothetical protein CEE62_06045 [Stenotrophomonas maltophilia]PJL02051.1 hypothetical protein B9Y76_06630 [Stenotrophomonas maltophilia]